ncbi:hypothetical protein [Thaumasiovibrio sp. DFM-14]|uniref:hypothetical protein n=1 Tax=Thaumasiovibrio sp. DFM-14 TaxID=3384792 RepID=UPI00399F635D
MAIQPTGGRSIYVVSPTVKSIRDESLTRAPFAPQTSQSSLDSTALRRQVAALEAAAQHDAEQQLENGSEKLKSFTYGAVGMDHPESVKLQEDEAYKAGQVLKAIGTVGGIIALLV